MDASAMNKPSGEIKPPPKKLDQSASLEREYRDMIIEEENFSSEETHKFLFKAPSPKFPGY
ncbi:MAG: hypothetical protein WC523_02285 [Patescibacteria group bacterium]